MTLHALNPDRLAIAIPFYRRYVVRISTVLSAFITEFISWYFSVSEGKFRHYTFKETTITVPSQILTYSLKIIFPSHTTLHYFCNWNSVVETRTNHEFRTSSSYVTSRLKMRYQKVTYLVWTSVELLATRLFAAFLSFWNWIRDSISELVMTASFQIFTYSPFIIIFPSHPKRCRITTQRCQRCSIQPVALLTELSWFIYLNENCPVQLVRMLTRTSDPPLRILHIILKKHLSLAVYHIKG